GRRTSRRFTGAPSRPALSHTLATASGLRTGWLAIGGRADSLRHVTYHTRQQAGDSTEQGRRRRRPAGRAAASAAAAARRQQAAKAAPVYKASLTAEEGLPRKRSPANVTDCCLLLARKEQQELETHLEAAAAQKCASLALARLL
ncbi:unnamed protein product, partial [Sphagnum tenellum]